MGEVLRHHRGAHGELGLAVCESFADLGEASGSVDEGASAAEFIAVLRHARCSAVMRLRASRDWTVVVMPRLSVEPCWLQQPHSTVLTSPLLSSVRRSRPALS